MNESTPSQIGVRLSTRVTILLASSLTVLAGAIVGPALPTIAERFREHERVELYTRLIITMPALVIAIVAPISGMIADRFGRRRLLVASLVLYAAAGTSGVYLESLEAVLVGRAVLGLAVAGVMTAATTLIGDQFAGEARGKFLGTQAAFMAVGGVFYLPLGGLMAQQFGWHGPFWVYAVALLIAGMAVAFVREPSRSTLAATSTGEAAAPWPTLVLIWATAAVLSAAFYLGPVQLPFLVQSRFSSGQLVTGLLMAVLTVHAAIVSLNFARVSRHLSRPTVFAGSFALMGVGFAVVGWASGMVMLIVGLVVAGLGAGLFMPNASAWQLAITPAPLRGRVVGVLTAAIFFGQFLSPILVQPLVASIGLGRSFVVAGVALAGAGLVYAGVWKFVCLRRA